MDVLSEADTLHISMANRFRSYLPVVIDVETGGFHSATDALLEIAASFVEFDSKGYMHCVETIDFPVAPFKGANIEQASLQVNGIDALNPMRPAFDEKEALTRLFREVRNAVKTQGCTKAILVGHNAHFDLGFLNAAVERAGIKRNPFHPFSVFDTATLAGVALGQTVLSRAVSTAGLEWDSNSAHSARYDTQRTAELFCLIVNRVRPVFEELVREAQ